MRFRVLGPIQIETQGGLADVGGPKVQQLMASLLAHHGSPVPQDVLAESLWPDSAKSRATLQSYVSRIRRCLGPDADLLVTTASGYSLTTAGHLDADEFEQLVDAGRVALRSGDHDTAAGLLSRALDQWHGAAYGECACLELVHGESVRLEELRLTAVEDLMTAEISRGRHREVIPELEKLCEEHPLREGFCELLMQALSRSGRQGEALRAYQQTRRHLVEQLGIEPGGALQMMEAMVLEHDRSVDAGTNELVNAGGPWGPGPTALPDDTTSFVGRRAEVTDVAAQLRGARLVTLIGFGGVGKTRLGLEVARMLAGSFPAGVELVDLATQVDPASVEPRISTAVQALVRRGPGEGLLLADNCEHLVAAAAAAVARVPEEHPEIRVLATSREALRIPGEVRWSVEPLPVPAEDTVEPIGNDSVRLFVQRAGAVRPDLDFDEAALARVCRICNSLEGIPLAIELAAGRVGSMGLGEIEDGLSERFELLTEGYRTAPARQQTLEAAIDWSYELLGDDEQRLLRELRPAALGFPARAAEVICARDADDEKRIRRALRHLVDQSLVRVESHEGEFVYSVLRTIVHFMFQRTGWQGRFENRGFVVMLAQQTAPELRGSRSEVWSALFDGPTDVARATLDLAYWRHDIEAGAFLAGVVAARSTRSGRIGFVGGVRWDYIQRFDAGFRAGAAHADPDVLVEGVYLSEPPDFSGFMETTPGRDGARELFGRDVDVVFHAAGLNGGQGVLEAAREWMEHTGEHRWVIGVDVDERIVRDRSLRPHVLTSMCRRIPIATYLEMKTAVAEGRADEAPLFDLSNEGVGLSTAGGGIDHLLPELETVRRRLISGEIPLDRHFAPLPAPYPDERAT